MTWSAFFTFTNHGLVAVEPRNVLHDAAVKEFSDKQSHRGVKRV